MVEVAGGVVTVRVGVDVVGEVVVVDDGLAVVDQ
jgi:hypothetical protein